MNKFLKAVIKIGNNLLQRIVYDIDYQIKNPKNRIRNDYQNLFRRNGLNICYNRFIARDYDPDKKNILIAIDSPAVIESYNVLKPEMEFIAEISFANFYSLKHYYCPRSLYATNDVVVYFNPSRKYKKSKLVSMIYSRLKKLKGHKFRHEVAEKFKDQIDRYGTGVDESIKTTDTKKIDTLDKYMFQIAIENGKYPEYVSEKFYDCIKTRTIPIYWGGEEAIKKMGFDTDGIFFFDTIEDLKKIFEENVSQKTYEEKKKAVDYNLTRLHEIRNEIKFNFYLNPIRIGYLNTEESYFNNNYRAFHLELD